MKYRCQSKTSNELKFKLFFLEGGWISVTFCLDFNVSSRTWVLPLSRQSESAHQNIVTHVSNSRKSE